MDDTDEFSVSISLQCASEEDSISLECASVSNCDEESISLPSGDWSSDCGSVFTQDDIFEDVTEEVLSPQRSSPPIALEYSLSSPLPLSKSFYHSQCQTENISTSLMSAHSISVPQEVDVESKEWTLSSVINMNRCSPSCAVQVHGLTEFEVLRAHSLFSDKSTPDQNKWILEYLNAHCPTNASGEKLPKDVKYIVAGKTVCLNIWLQILSLSLSRFYRSRQECVQFEANSGFAAKKPRSTSSKTTKSIAWMRQYFDRVGPDKDGICLPTCLTEKKMHEIMMEQLGAQKGVCLSQFNKIRMCRFLRLVNRNKHL